MIAFDIIFAILALGFVCWLLFNLAVYALPCFVGVSAGFWAFHHGSGIAVALLIGLVSGAVTLVLGQYAFANLRTPLARMTIALAFATPAGFAGYYAALGLARDLGANPSWGDAVGVLGALLIGATAFVRISSGPFGGVAEVNTVNDHLPVGGL